MSLAFAVLLLCILAVLGVLYYQAWTKTNVQATEIAQATATLQAQANEIEQAAATVQAQATTIAQAEATMQAQSREILRANSTLDAQATRIAAIPFGFETKLARGPLSGRLDHNSDTLFESRCGDVDLKNFVVSVQFSNPFGVSENPVSYGVTFRRYRFRLAISLRENEKSLALNDGSSDLLESVTLRGRIRLGSGESNRMLVVVKDNAIFTYVNDEFAGSMYVKGLSDSTGDVCVSTGLYQGDEVPGNSTGYSEFMIWSLP
jgi:Tfp pilus assembly protein PilE